MYREDNLIRSTPTGTIPEPDYPIFRTFEELIPDFRSVGENAYSQLRDRYTQHLQMLRENLDKSVSKLSHISSNKNLNTVYNLMLQQLYNSTQKSVSKLESFALLKFSNLLNSPKLGTKRARNRNFIEFNVGPMEEWWNQHFDNPYPSEQEKEELSKKCSLSVKQVSTWFANKRARDYKKKEVDETSEPDVPNLPSTDVESNFDFEFNQNELDLLSSLELPAIDLPKDWLSDESFNLLSGGDNSEFLSSDNPFSNTIM